jgi:glutathione-specific gamma-glutamylcyclotransferase
MAEDSRPRLAPADHDVWFFGYGSLMWRAGFAFEEARRARLVGYRRSFCIYSTHHRGTEARPGLVLGLDRSGVCEGIVFRVAAKDAHSVLQYLRERELVSGVYREVNVPIDIEGPGGHVRATAFVAERAHPSYAAALPLSVQARLIRGARGLSGANLDYFINTMRHLSELGIRERALERLLAMAGPHFGREPGAPQVSPRVAALQRATRGKAGSGGFRRLRPGDRNRFPYRRHMYD